MWTPRVTRAQGTLAGDLPPLKSESHALKLSLLGTGVPIAVGAAIAILGVSHDTYVDFYIGTTFETTNHWGVGPGLAAISAGLPQTQ